MKLTPQTYFRLSLVLPFLLPLVVLVFGFNLLTGVLLMSLFFGGLPYLFFALCLFFVIARLRTVHTIRRLSYAAPLLFIPFQTAFWLAPLFIAMRSGEGYGGDWSVLSSFAMYILVLGYLYVVLINLVFGYLQRKGAIVDFEGMNSVKS